jgi:hypothetical protein
MSLRERTRPGFGIIEPCLPSLAEAPPSGPGWLHEIKHDGFRILARRDGAGVRLITRAGNDFSTIRWPGASGGTNCALHSYWIDSGRNWEAYRLLRVRLASERANSRVLLARRPMRAPRERSSRPGSPGGVRRL